MTLTTWLVLIGIFVPVVVQLGIAHLGRKQTRQAEAFRIDPSVGLVPPRSKLTRFVLAYGGAIVVGTFCTVVLVYDMNRTGPITRWTIFEIALSMSGLTLVLVLATITSAFEFRDRAAEKRESRVEEILAGLDEAKKDEKKPSPTR